MLATWDPEEDRRSERVQADLHRLAEVAYRLRLRLDEDPAPGWAKQCALDWRDLLGAVWAVERHLPQAARDAIWTRD